jgi:hypothetical protein
VAADAVLENYEAAAFYIQWLRDVADTQTYLNGAQFHYLNGSVPDCVVSSAPSARPPARPSVPARRPHRLCALLSLARAVALCAHVAQALTVGALLAHQPFVWPCHSDGDPGCVLLAAARPALAHAPPNRSRAPALAQLGLCALRHHGLGNHALRRRRARRAALPEPALARRPLVVLRAGSKLFLLLRVLWRRESRPFPRCSARAPPSLLRAASPYAAPPARNTTCAVDERAGALPGLSWVPFKQSRPSRRLHAPAHATPHTTP